MKKIILNPSLTLSFIFITVFLFAQNNESLVFAEMKNPAKNGLVKNISVVSSNLNEVLDEVNSYLKNNVKTPEIMGFYNTSMKVMVSFVVSEEGEIRDIVISEKSDKVLGSVVVKELNKLSKITPVIEDGKAVEKNINVPVIFKID